VYNGENLESLWLMPVKSQRSWRPVQLTLTLRINPHLWRPLKNYGQDNHSERRTVTFKLPIYNREPDLVPGYMNYMNQGPRSDEEVLRTQGTVRDFFK
jgi:hypothetical protein